MIRRVCKVLGFNPESFANARSNPKTMFDQGNTVPASGTAGYGVGAIFQHRDGGAGTALYINEGTESSCDFQPVAALTAAQEALISATAGTATASKAVILDANKHIDVVETASLKLGATGATVAVTATAAELNQLDGAIIADAAVTEGAGITGQAAVCEHSVTKIGGIYKTEIIIDLTGLESTATDGDIIGDSGGGAAHIGQITTARNGVIFAGRVTCLEAPTTGDDDIAIYSATEATGVYDGAIGDLTETLLLDNGAWTLGLVNTALVAFPADAQYLYLAAKGGDTAGSYATGIFLIELWGK